MRALGLVATGTAALALFAAGGVASAQPTGFYNCGLSNAIGRHKWAIQTVGFSCRSGRAIVRTFAAKIVPREGTAGVVSYPGTFAGMSCMAGPAGHKPTSIACTTLDSAQQLRAVRMF
jgi:hypothetical protein